MFKFRRYILRVFILSATFPFLNVFLSVSLPFPSHYFLANIALVGINKFFIIHLVARSTTLKREISTEPLQPLLYYIEK